MEVEPVIELKAVSKSFGPIRALKEASLRVFKGRVHAVVGENGAGKSTLMKLAYGSVATDRGEVWIKGKRVGLRHSPAQSIDLGVGMVHQHFKLVGPLSVAENLYLGHEPTQCGVISRASFERSFAKVNAQIEVGASLDQRVETLSVGQKQRIEIARVLLQQCDVLILDEPTAVLSPMEVEELFDSLRSLVGAGSSIVLITHKIDEIMAIADDVTVMRGGAVVKTLTLRDHDTHCLNPDITAQTIADAIVGKQAPAPITRKSVALGNVVLSANKICAKDDLGNAALKNVSFELRAGEIVGIAGVQGNGQSELCECVAGLRLVQSGSLTLNGAELEERSVRQRYAMGVGHIAEDRHERALLLDASVEDNILLSRHDDFRKGPAIARDKLRAKTKDLIEAADLRPKNPDAQVRHLSGGNQQKIVVARECDRPNLKLLVCGQPTRGVDIGAIDLIHRRLLKTRSQGVAMLLVSAELSELRTLADRVLVFYGGKISAEFSSSEISTDEGMNRLGAAMTGVS